MTFSDATSAIKARLETEERTRDLLREWESISLQGSIKKSEDNHPMSGLGIKLSRLTEIQRYPPDVYRNDTIMINKVLSAVMDVDACKLACHKPLESLQGNISDLQASVATVGNGNNFKPSVNMVDRRYHNPNQGKKGKRFFVISLADDPQII